MLLRRHASIVGASASMVLMVAMYLSVFLPAPAVDWLIPEEHPIELLGALMLLACSIACIVLWRRSADGSWILKLVLLGLALLFFFGFGEELSWGQRIFGVETPEAVAEANAQGELNFHNLKALHLLDPDVLFQFFWLGFGVLIPLVALAARLRKTLQRLLPVLPAWVAVVLIVNQILIKGLHTLFTARPELYRSRVYEFDYTLFEIKESVVSVALAAGLWVLVAHRDADRTSAEPASGSADEAARTS